MCAHRHFNHKSTVWGLENLRKGDWQKGIKSTQRSKPLEALLSGWERATQNSQHIPSVGDDPGCNNHQWGWPRFPRDLGRGHNPGCGQAPQEQPLGQSCPEAAPRGGWKSRVGRGGGGGAPGRAGGEGGACAVSLRAEYCPRLAGARSLTKEQDVVDLSPNHREEMIVNFL